MCNCFTVKVSVSNFKVENVKTWTTLSMVRFFNVFLTWHFKKNVKKSRFLNFQKNVKNVFSNYVCHTQVTNGDPLVGRLQVVGVVELGKQFVQQHSALSVTFDYCYWYHISEFCAGLWDNNITRMTITQMFALFDDDPSSTELLSTPATDNWSLYRNSTLTVSRPDLCLRGNFWWPLWTSSHLDIPGLLVLPYGILVSKAGL